MGDPLTAEQLAELREFDSATIANGIEPFGVRDASEGYTGMRIRCLFPHFEQPMVGYAVTVRGDSVTHARPRDRTLQFRLWEALEASRKPALVVIQDAGVNPAKSCHCGDVMGTIIKALGGVGIVTDGGVRDLREVEELGLHYFARGVTVSHGTAVLFDAGEPVVIDGLPIATGDLLHGDANGIVKIPLEIADRLADSAREILRSESERKAFGRRPGFTAAKFRDFLGL